MSALREKAAHWECAAASKKQFSSRNIAASEDENKTRTAKIAKRLADYVQVLKPRLIVVADEEVFSTRPLARLRGRFQQAKAGVTVQEICRLVRRDADTVRGIVLADPTGWDVAELAKASEREVLTLNCGGAQ